MVDAKGRDLNQAWIVSIGAELALGQTVDTNAAWLAAELARLGVRTERHLTVTDDLGTIRDAVTQAADAAEIVLITGGLGPTDDDVTRQALAEAAGEPLVRHAASLEQIRAFFAARGREMIERNAIQAMFPRGAEPIENTCGTAPGIAMSLHDTPVFAMPGVPFEMKTMFERDVAPRIKSGVSAGVILSTVLRCFGLGESDLGERIADLMKRGRNPEIGTTADLGVIGIRINATADSEPSARELLADAEAELRSRLGRHVFGRDDDTLASVVGAVLAKRRQSLSIAESCTGGLIAKLITDVAGSSAYFVGGAVTYSDEMKTSVLGVDPELLEAHGAVSEPVAEAMARGASTKFDTDYAVAVTGIAGPAGGSPDKPVGLVYLAVAEPGTATVRRLLLGADAPRHVIRQRAAMSALDLLRRRLVPNCGQKAAD